MTMFKFISDLVALGAISDANVNQVNTVSATLTVRNKNFKISQEMVSGVSTAKVIRVDGKIKAKGKTAILKFIKEM